MHPFCAGFLLYRVIKMGSDARFDDTRDNFFKFLAFWIFQVGIRPKPDVYGVMLR